MQTDHTTDPRQEILDAAYARGCDAADAAASWAADGNTTPAHAARVLAMLDDGDPEAWDHLPPTPNLSGEWADGPTPTSLAWDLCGPGADLDSDDGLELVDEIATRWEAGVSDTFEEACEIELRSHLA